MIEAIDTGIAPSSAPISDCVRAGNQLWMVAIAEDPKTGAIVDGGIEAQARQALANLRQCVEAAGGTGPQHRAGADIPDRQRRRAGHEPGLCRGVHRAPVSMRATVVVKELLAKGLRIEITATAVLDETSR